MLENSWRRSYCASCIIKTVDWKWEPHKTSYGLREDVRSRRLCLSTGASADHFCCVQIIVLRWGRQQLAILKSAKLDHGHTMGALPAEQ